MPDGFSSFEDIINNEPGLEKIRRIIKEYDVIEKFFEIFPGLKKIAVPVKTEKKVLFIKVENPAWRNELKFKEKTIIEKINTFFTENDKSSEEEIIKKIKLLP
jgi:hypothetical protein